MSDDRVKPKSKGQIAKETITGLVATGIGLGLVFWAPERFGTSSLYFGAGFIGFGMYVTNKKLVTEWLIQLRDLLRFWKNGD